MQNLKNIVSCIVVLIIFMNHSLPTRGQSASDTNTRFQAELIEDGTARTQGALIETPDLEGADPTGEIALRKG